MLNCIYHFIQIQDLGHLFKNVVVLSSYCHYICSKCLLSIVVHLVSLVSGCPKKHHKYLLSICFAHLVSLVSGHPKNIISVAFPYVLLILCP